LPLIKNGLVPQSDRPVLAKMTKKWLKNSKNDKMAKILKSEILEMSLRRYKVIFYKFRVFSKTDDFGKIFKKSINF